MFLSEEQLASDRIVKRLYHRVRRSAELPNRICCVAFILGGLGSRIAMPMPSRVAGRTLDLREPSVTKSQTLPTPGVRIEMHRNYSKTRMRDYSGILEHN